MEMAGDLEDRRSVRRHLPRPSLRHRRPARLHQGVVQLAADRDDLGPDLRPWLKDSSPTLEYLTMATAAIPTLRDGTVTLRPIRAARRQGARARAHRQPRLAAQVGGHLPRWRDRVSTRAPASGFCSATRAPAMPCRSSIELDGELAGQLNVSVDHLRVALVGVDRLLGLASGRGQGDHADRRGAGDRLLLLRDAAAPDGDLHPPRERSRRLRVVEKLGSATRGSVAGSSTSTATGATTSLRPRGRGAAGWRVAALARRKGAARRRRAPARRDRRRRHARNTPRLIVGISASLSYR